MKHEAWNPWHGCHKYSEGCQNCYVHFLDSQRGKDANNVVKSKTAFNLPIKKGKDGQYKFAANSEIYTCFTSDFFIEEADEWRDEAWKMISQRPDLLFLIPTKRIHRFLDCIPADWGYGYKNVIIAVSTENQTQADNRLPILLELPIVHKEVFVSPILEYVNLTQYLSAGKIELVSVGGESYSGARICDFAWVQRIKSDCDRFHTPFTFHQTGSLFKLGSRIYNIPHNKEYSQAIKARKILDKVQRQE